MPPKKTTTSKTTAKKASTAADSKPVKKTVTKASAAKKATTKKTVAKTTPVKTSTPKTTTKKTCNTGCLHGAYGALLLFLIGVIGGGIWYMMNHAAPKIDENNKIIRYNEKTYVSIKNIEDGFKLESNKGQGIVVHNGQSWIPVPGLPIEVIVVSDTSCGAPCDTSQALAALRQNITPALITRVVDITSEEGASLVESFDIQSVPAYFLGEGAAEFQVNGTKFVDGAAEVFVQKDELYMFNSKAGLPVGRYIEPPAIDTDDEPQIGNGSIKVIEFTDYQCPYCQRLHDQNKDLIQELVDAGTITYVIKDFPLSFHANAMPVHAALSCTKREAGNDAYFAMKNDIFADQADWGSKTGNTLTDYLVSLADTHGADITECITDDSISAEIQADLEEGTKYGVTGTPGLFIGRQFAPGAISPEQLRSMVEAESQ